jgi:hypothetical protein
MIEPLLKAKKTVASGFDALGLDHDLKHVASSEEAI